MRKLVYVVAVAIILIGAPLQAEISHLQTFGVTEYVNVASSNNLFGAFAQFAEGSTPSYVQYGLRSPSGLISQRDLFQLTTSIWLDSLRFNATIETGIWRVSWLRFGSSEEDTLMTETDLVDRNFQVSCDVVNIEDNTAPSLLHAEAVQAVVDVSSCFTCDASIDLEISDSETGVVYVSGILRSPAVGTEKPLERTSTLGLVEGDRFRGVWRSSFPLCLGVRRGVWELSQVEMQDRQGNRRILDANNLAAAGHSVSIGVTDLVRTDFDPPVVHLAVFLPDTLDLDTGSDSLILAIRWSDYSGVRNVTFHFEEEGSSRPLDLQLPGSDYCNYGNFGNGYNGVGWFGWVHVDRSQERGNWQLHELRVTDNQSNLAAIGRDSFESWGVPTTFVIRGSPVSVKQTTWSSVKAMYR